MCIRFFYPAAKNTEAKANVSCGKHREKVSSAANFTTEQVVTENNFFGPNTVPPKGLMEYGQAVASWTQYAEGHGLTPEQKQAGLDKLAKGDLPEGANITKAIVEGYQDGALIAGAGYLGPAATAGKVVAGSVVGAIANGTYQWFDMSQPRNDNKSWDYLSNGVAAVTGGLAAGRGIWVNTGIAVGSAFFTDGYDAGAIGGATLGSLTGGVVGKYAPDLLQPVLGSSSGVWAEIGSAFTSEVVSDTTKDIISHSGMNKK